MLVQRCNRLKVILTGKTKRFPSPAGTGYSLVKP
jgi:hypothetical protein